MTLSDEDREVIRSSLIAAESAGVVNPLLPDDVDADGDGLVDAYGLDGNGQVVLVRSVPLSETLYEADDVDDEDVSVEVGDPVLREEA